MILLSPSVYRMLVSRPLRPRRRSSTLCRVGSLLLAVLTAAACGTSEGTPTDVGMEDPGDPVRDRLPPPDVVRGIYVNAQAAGSAPHLSDLLAMADASELNTFVVDMKERGEVSYASSVPLAVEIGSVRDYIGDLDGLVRTLRDHGIHPIARIVCFRDPVLAEARPDLAIRTTDGSLWLDPESGRPWVDPYSPEVWDYNIDLAREALSAGFAEIQWDYVRFPDVSDSVRAEMVFPDYDGRAPSDLIRDFVDTSRQDLADFGVPVTADVFGRVITVTGESNIGQNWERLVRVMDVILPMVYPALYWPGNFGIEDPDAEPYRTVRAAMDSAVVRMDRTDGAIASIRPWLQAFTEGTTVYGPTEMREQIRAVEDAGLQEWLFWNPSSVYPAEAFQ
ncbi:MAG: putative glycoside hydrolase [Longimicrobiales bacterium]|nr:putative glycoside hydrolase [Longimicrobiales bacterium]